MTTKQNDAGAMTERQLKTMVGGAPHYQDFNGRPRFQLVGGTMCSARSAQTKRSKRFELEHGQGFGLHNNGV